MAWKCRLLVTLAALLLVGCQAPRSGEGGGIRGAGGQFAQSYRQALAQGRYDVLYDMLDSESRMQLSNELERLRLLPRERQQAFAKTLGDPPLGDPARLTDEAFFARLWYQVVRDKTLEVRLIDQGPRRATLSLDTHDGQQQTIDVFVEGDRWVWRLPLANGP